MRVATVVNFPAGTAPVAEVVVETRSALADGADEIDLVVPWRALGRRAAGGGDGDGRAAIREVCGPATLKTILETGELADPGLIRAAAEAALAGGADFLKTSTGKVRVNATPEAARILLEAIRASGRDAGLKPAGGVRTTADAGVYLGLCDADHGAGLGDARALPHRRLGGADGAPRDARRRRRRRGRAGAATDAAAGGHRPEARRRHAAGRGDPRLRRGADGGDDRRGAGRGLRDGGALPRHGPGRAGRADRGDARLRHGARLGPAGAGRRQALDRRHRRHGEPDARAGARRLRRLSCR